MKWIYFFVLAVVLIFVVQFVHYLIKGEMYKFKNPLMPSLIAVVLASLINIIYSYTL